MQFATHYQLIFRTSYQPNLSFIEGEESYIVWMALPSLAGTGFFPKRWLIVFVLICLILLIYFTVHQGIKTRLYGGNQSKTYGGPQGSRGGNFVVKQKTDFLLGLIYSPCLVEQREKSTCSGIQLKGCCFWTRLSSCKSILCCHKQCNFLHLNTKHLYNTKDLL